jgi:hypothetical protein
LANIPGIFMLPKPNNPTYLGLGANPEQAELPESLASHYERIEKLIQRSHQTFLRELPDLLKTHRGRWVAYHGDKRLGFGRSKTKLIKQWHACGVPQGELGLFFVIPDFPDEDVEWVS